MIFDSHAHYDDPAFDGDREELLNSLCNFQIGTVVNVGSSLVTSHSSVELARKYEYVYAAVGVHPDEVGYLNDESLAELQSLCREPKVVAIGEIGLDYYWDKASRDIQKYWFKKQLELAFEVNLPIVVHSREACADTMDMLHSMHASEYKGELHCFSYSPETAREVLAMDWYLGIGGVITFKNAAKLKETVSMYPLERLLLETDCPYLAPVPYRGKRNFSGNLSYVISAIAEIKGISEEEVIEVTDRNAHDFFRIKR